MSPDLNMIENLWLGLKHAVHARWPKNNLELKAFCKEKWGKTLKFKQIDCKLVTGNV